ncbi:hypothetical protein BD309DRAFT_861738 [Dichomitus squalens]|uniref:Mitochondrial intermembrane space import and assembly protein 40 n=1 Tax=Dichomitus squalens TaxID=114155 RepID=A0A4Q9NVD4_9APHY|nr:hypothetical protein BD311DRAFT_755066 [Dichomitus squalens]TBU44707.1 hypothetical protein BD309DRAFT_861738 [Dichomitus squalens]TBU56901.1 hypothetical protein BD310DRAFT_822689 [Dichomitus squalens]
MFRTLATASLRPSLHTSLRPAASARPARLRAVLGASAVATSYFVWNAWYGQGIALDAPASSSKQVSLTPKSSTSPEAISRSPSTAPEHEPSIPPNSPSPSGATPHKEQPPTEGETEESSGSGQGGAFNPETGEINWDCPCLGGMAHGPCGLQFREAFSCFVFSEAEPKGIDCVEKFKAMQECFREHPDVYGEDIMADDEDEEGFSQDTPSSPDVADGAKVSTDESSERSGLASHPAAEQKSSPRSAASH